MSEGTAMSVWARVGRFVPVEQIDPGVKPNSTAPWMPALRDVAGMVMVTAIVIAVIIIIIGVVLAIAGKLGAMQTAQSAGWMILVWGLIGAAVIGGVSGLVLWATTIQLAPAKAVGVFLGAAGLVG
ncbi:hypothetical protein ACX801_17995 [Arthrobacter bambusae]